MYVIIAIVAIVGLILLVPPIFLVIGGVVFLFVPGLEIFEIIVIVLGIVKLLLAKKNKS